MSEKQPPNREYFTSQLWKNNQILTAILGICSALAVTNNMQIALTMGIAVSFVTACSSFLVSAIRKVTPDSVRMITQLAVISMFVIIVDQFLKAYFFDISKKLSVFVGLIITNCIVMGRAEAMAKTVTPIPAFLDGLGAGLGYAIILMAIGVFRETLGFGTFFGHRIIPLSWYASAENPNGYQDFGLMVVAPAAFFLIGMFIWIANIFNAKKTQA
jgi:Na+-transporting NADH:ubiquinone oxidoreductase subunit D